MVVHDRRPVPGNEVDDLAAVVGPARDAGEAHPASDAGLRGSTDEPWRLRDEPLDDVRRRAIGGLTARAARARRSGCARRARLRRTPPRMMPPCGGRRSAELRRLVVLDLVVPAQCAALNPPNRVPSLMRNDDVQSVESRGGVAPGTSARCENSSSRPAIQPSRSGGDAAPADPQRVEPARRDEVVGLLEVCSGRSAAGTQPAARTAASMSGRGHGGDRRRDGVGPPRSWRG